MTSHALTTSEACDELLRVLAKGDDGLTALLGAGISLEAPSNLPLAIHWKRCIFDALWAKSRASHTHAALYAPLWSFVERIPLEAALQAARPVLQAPTFAKLFDSFAGSTPNRSHDALARLTHEGFVDTLITTNFDCCLEDALLRHEVPHSVCMTDADFASRIQPSPPEIYVHTAFRKAIGFKIADGGVYFSPSMDHYVVLGPSPEEHREGRALVAKLHGSSDRPRMYGDRVFETQAVNLEGVMLAQAGRLDEARSRECWSR